MFYIAFLSLKNFEDEYSGKSQHLTFFSPYNGRRGGIAAGVVVADDDAGAVAYNRRAKYLGGAQDGAVDGALVAADIVYHLILRIEHQDAHLV
jgi:hypothetical protein